MDWKNKKRTEEFCKDVGALGGSRRNELTWRSTCIHRAVWKRGVTVNISLVTLYRKLTMIKSLPFFMLYSKFWSVKEKYALMDIRGETFPRMWLVLF